MSQGANLELEMPPDCLTIQFYHRCHVFLLSTSVIGLQNLLSLFGFSDFSCSGEIFLFVGCLVSSQMLTLFISPPLWVIGGCFHLIDVFVLVMVFIVLKRTSLQKHLQMATSVWTISFPSSVFWVSSESLEPC